MEGLVPWAPEWGEEGMGPLALMEPEEGADAEEGMRLLKELIKEEEERKEQEGEEQDDVGKL